MLKPKYIKVLAAMFGLALAASAHAQVVLGSFQSAGDPNNAGWVDSQSTVGNGPISTSTNCTFVNAGVTGYSTSLVASGPGGFGHPQLTVSLSAVQRTAFNSNSWLTFTFSVPGGTYTGGYFQLYNLAFNAPGYGYNNQNWANALEMGNTNNTAPGTRPNYYFNNGANGVQTMVVSYNYSSVTNAIMTNSEGYLQFTFQFNDGGGAPSNAILNNVFLSQNAFGAGILASNVYIVDDFSTNGVATNNPAGDDYYGATNWVYANGQITNVWSQWFGNGGPGGTFAPISFNPNVNPVSTNANGAMQVNFTWNAASDGYQQWIAFHGYSGSTPPTFTPATNGGAVGIGYPFYTNVSCDVKFDPSSLSCTNTNGVLGVIRIGIRGTGVGGQDWANNSYTTITDTNWHHISGTLNPANPDSLNLADALIGEDVNNSVGGGGLTGNQILYVANIKFTGPLGVVIIPPPKLATPTKATPSLRIFAGSSVNTYDRAMLYTENSTMNSWVGATPGAPVTYAFSLLDFNPNIGQTMVELIGPPTTPTSSGEFADYSGPNTLWLQLNPAANGAVVASVQWKTNSPGSNPGGTANPYGQALSFTNSTAIGSWALVFTGPNTGYVISPGTVILGSKNFTINDGTVGSDFANPVFAGFGLQPNSTAGEGAFEDWGFIAITNTAAGTQFEDFTKESGDFVAGFTPSGLFNNGMSALPSGLIIQTTNDAWWVSWSQPAAGFTLSSITNLQKTNWINPGWYSGYLDTNAPRVMAVKNPFGNNFWVLLPGDDVPTANGLQNSGSPGPATQPAAPDAFFRLGTNTVSP